MKELFASATFGMIGLALFFTVFVGILIWVMRPSSKEKFDSYANIPLKDDKDDRP